MFTHLDDPTPYTPPAGLRSSVRRRARRRRQRRVAVVGGVASVAALGVGAVTAARDRLEPQRIEVGGLADESSPAAVLDTEPRDAGEPVTVLVVGIDGARSPGLQDDGSPRDWPGHTDTMAVVRIDPGAGEVRLLSIPRDLVLEGEADRINTALATGGPSELVRLVDTQLGIPVDHYVQVDFAGAVELVDALGGIRVAVDAPIRDDQTGSALVAGCQTLDGTATLGLGRARSVEVQQPDGSWQSDPSSAIGREARGAAVAAALLQAAGRFGLSDLPALIRTGLGSLTVDDSLETDDLERWARDARDDRFVPLGLPVVDDVVEGQQVLRLGDGAAAVVDAFRDGGTDPVPVVVDGAPVTDHTGLRPC